MTHKRSNVDDKLTATLRRRGLIMKFNASQHQINKKVHVLNKIRAIENQPYNYNDQN